MKNKFRILLLLTILSTVLFACTPKSTDNVDSVDKTEDLSTETEQKSEESEQSEEDVDNMPIRVAAMKGPTGMGFAKMFEDSETGESSFEIQHTIVGAADEIVAGIGKGDIDIAAVPANLASILYNNTEGKVKVLSVNTLGVLYIIEKGDSIKSVADLKGLTISSPGKGTTPEFTLKHILAENGLDPETDVVLDFKSEATEATQSFLQGQSDVVMLPEPYLSGVLAKNPDVNIAINLDDGWEALNGKDIGTGVLIGRTEFIEENPEAVEKFLNEYEKSINYAVENVDAAAELVGKYEIAPAEIAVKAIPNSSLHYADGEELKSLLGDYLEILYGYNPKSVGGKLPDENFYFEG